MLTSIHVGIFYVLCLQISCMNMCATMPRLLMVLSSSSSQINLMLRVLSIRWTEGGFTSRLKWLFDLVFGLWNKDIDPLRLAVNYLADCGPMPLTLYMPMFYAPHNSVDLCFIFCHLQFMHVYINRLWCVINKWLHATFNVISVVLKAQKLCTPLWRTVYVWQLSANIIF